MIFGANVKLWQNNHLGTNWTGNCLILSLSISSILFSWKSRYGVAFLLGYNYANTLLIHTQTIYIYIYIYREREREMNKYTLVYIYIYIYIYIYTQTHTKMMNVWVLREELKRIWLLWDFASLRQPISEENSEFKPGALGLITELVSHSAQM